MIDIKQIESRRAQLGMSYRVLGQRSNLSPATVVRMFRDGLEHSTFGNVLSVLGALGLEVETKESSSPYEMRESEAQRRASQIASLVQGTSDLEGQAVSEAVKNEIQKQAFHELMAKPKSRFWTGGVDGR